MRFFRIFRSRNRNAAGRGGAFPHSRQALPHLKERLFALLPLITGERGGTDGDVVQPFGRLAENSGQREEDDAAFDIEGAFAEIAGIGRSPCGRPCWRISRPELPGLSGRLLVPFFKGGKDLRSHAAGQVEQGPELLLELFRKLLAPFGQPGRLLQNQLRVIGLAFRVVRASGSAPESSATEAASAHAGRAGQGRR